MSIDGVLHLAESSRNQLSGIETKLNIFSSLLFQLAFFLISPKYIFWLFLRNENQWTLNNLFLFYHYRSTGQSMVDLPIESIACQIFTYLYLIILTHILSTWKMIKITTNTTILPVSSILPQIIHPLSVYLSWQNCVMKCTNYSLLIDEHKLIPSIIYEPASKPCYHYVTPIQTVRM